MCGQKFREKNHLFLETKMTKYVLQLYIYTATFYGFHMLSKFVQSQCEIRYIRPVIVVGAVITHKMFDAGTKHQQQMVC